MARARIVLVSALLAVGALAQMEQYTGRITTTHHHQGPKECPSDQDIRCKTITTCAHVDKSGAEHTAACPTGKPKGTWHKKITDTCMCMEREHNPFITCAGGQEFSTCASACTPTCANLHPACSKQCVQRCACPSTLPLWDKTEERCVRRDVCSETELEADNGMCHEDEKSEAAFSWSKSFGCGVPEKLGWWFEHAQTVTGDVTKVFDLTTSEGQKISVAEMKHECDKEGDSCAAFVFSPTNVKILSKITGRSAMSGTTYQGQGVYYKPLCPTPLHPADGMYEVVGGGIGAVARVQCGAGFRLIGSAKRMCTAAGTWSGSTPYCEQDACAAPPALAGNGKVLLESGIAMYSCDPGYELEGSSERTCTADTWSGVQAKCTAACDGEPPAAPAHGKAQEHGDTQAWNVVGARVHYHCEGVFYASGAKTYSECQRQTEGGLAWSTPDFSCKAIECYAPRQIAHASLSDNGPDYYGEPVLSGADYPIGRLAKYQCHTGYQMLGTELSTCEHVQGQDMGRWSALPKCVKFQQCKHMGCVMHNYAVTLKQIGFTGPDSALMSSHHMRITHCGSHDDGRRKCDTPLPDSHPDARAKHQCRYDKKANDGKGGCQCLCWHEDSVAQAEEMAARNRQELASEQTQEHVMRDDTVWH
jgi:hypothetical protein